MLHIYLPDYALRLETMILMTEFDAAISDIRATLQFYDGAIDQVTHSDSIDKFLQVVLQFGNFINTVPLSLSPSLSHGLSMSSSINMASVLGQAHGQCSRLPYIIVGQADRY